MRATDVTIAALAGIDYMLASAAHATAVGQWTNVTPAAIDLNAASFNNDNYGVQDV